MSKRREAPRGVPTPDRFREYEEIIDARNRVIGFRLSTGEEFSFDKYGGWFDENNHYYNAEGVPTRPPPDVEEEEEDEDLGDEDYDDSLLDDYDIGDDPGGHIDYTDYDKTIEIENKISSLRSVDKMTYTLQVSNIPRGVTKADLEKFFNEDNTLSDIHIDLNEPKTGMTKTAILNFSNRDDAISCVQKHKKKLHGESILIDVESYEDDEHHSDYEDVESYNYPAKGGPGQQQQHRPQTAQPSHHAPGKDITRRQEEKPASPQKPTQAAPTQKAPAQKSEEKPAPKDTPAQAKPAETKQQEASKGKPQPAAKEQPKEEPKKAAEPEKTQAKPAPAQAPVQTAPVTTAPKGEPKKAGGLLKEVHTEGWDDVVIPVRPKTTKTTAPTAGKPAGRK